jgi:hypothetical protein
VLAAVAAPPQLVAVAAASAAAAAAAAAAAGHAAQPHDACELPRGDEDSEERRVRLDVGKEDAVWWEDVSDEGEADLDLDDDDFYDLYDELLQQQQLNRPTHAQQRTLSPRLQSLMEALMHREEEAERWQRVMKRDVCRILAAAGGMAEPGRGTGGGRRAGREGSRERTSSRSACVCVLG